MRGPEPETGPGRAGRLSGGAVRPLLLCPDAALRQGCAPAGYLDAGALTALAADLAATLRALAAAGISAPQIGVARRMVVLAAENASAEGAEEPLVLCDPEVLVQTGAAETAEESCLSWPGGRAGVTRAAGVLLGWYDLDGCHRQRAFDGAQARVIQRQVDILDGRFIGGF